MSWPLLDIAWVLFCLALPLSIAGSNIGWGLILLALGIRFRHAGKISRALNILTHGTWREVYAAYTGHSALMLPIGLYCGTAIVADLSGTDPMHSLRFLNQDLHKLWLCFLFALGLPTISASAQSPSKDALAHGPFENAVTARRMIAALAAGFATFACVGLYQVFMRYPNFWDRPNAFVHPVTFGEMAALAWLGALAFVCRPPGWSRIYRIGAWVLMGLLAVVLFFNQTRGAILGAGIAVILLQFADSKLFRLSLAGGLLAAAFLIGSDLLPSGRSLISAVSRQSEQPLIDNPQMDRLKLWRTAWEMFLDHPWTGVGVNNFRSQSPRYFTGLINNETAMGTAHNLYLHQLAERGVVGICALAFLFWTLWHRSWTYASRRCDPWSLWAFAATVAFTAMNLTEVALQTEQVWMPFFFIWIWAEKQ